MDYITNNNLNDLELEYKKISFKYNDIIFEMTGSHNEKLDTNSTLITVKVGGVPRGTPPTNEGGGIPPNFLYFL